ncbi:hypothetical protein BTN82_10390 [Pseudomonas chlororaphis]|uniref:Uncharacterized protein n=1 Tax=Pseudomonas chlororaphis TaxID=587753 RepID=A0A1Q8ERI7_9PSED|nr:hypothetical protein BTN82_10390 [Pseudomonas chlororaphis]
MTLFITVHSSRADAQAWAEARLQELPGAIQVLALNGPYARVTLHDHVQKPPAELGSVMHAQCWVLTMGTQ